MEQSKVVETTGDANKCLIAESAESIEKRKKYNYVKDVIINVLRESQFSVETIKHLFNTIKWEVRNTATL